MQKKHHKQSKIANSLLWSESNSTKAMFIVYILIKGHLSLDTIGWGTHMIR